MSACRGQKKKPSDLNNGWQVRRKQMGGGELRKGLIRGFDWKVFNPRQEKAGGAVGVENSGESGD